MPDFDKLVTMVAWRYGKTHEEREDFMQEARLALLGEQKNIELMGEDDATKFAYVVCRNAILKILRDRQPEYSLTDQEAKEAVANFTGFEEIEQKLDLEIIVRKLDKLPAPYPEVIRCRFGINRPRETLTEIADRHGVTAKTVQRWEQRALEILKGKLK